MYSRPAPTSIGTMCPGNFVAKEISPGAPIARYSVINSDPPPATRFSTPKSPPPPPNCVCVVNWIELLIQESSPASETTDSFGSSVTSSTGMVVPRMRDCMGASPQERRTPECITSAPLPTRMEKDGREPTGVNVQRERRTLMNLGACSSRHNRFSLLGLPALLSARIHGRRRVVVSFAGNDCGVIVLGMTIQSGIDLRPHSAFCVTAINVVADNVGRLTGDPRQTHIRSCARPR